MVLLGLALSPDRHTLASGGYNGTIRLWDVTDPAHPQPLGHRLTSGTTEAFSVAFSPDGHTLASGGYNGPVRSWDVTDPAHPQPIGPSLTNQSVVDSVAFSPHRHMSADTSGEMALSKCGKRHRSSAPPANRPAPDRRYHGSLLAFSPRPHPGQRRLQWHDPAMERYRSSASPAHRPAPDR